MSVRQLFARVLISVGVATLIAGSPAPLTAYYLGDQGRVVERVSEMPPLAVGFGVISVIFALAAWRGSRGSLIPLFVGVGLIWIVVMEAAKDPSVEVTTGAGLPLTVVGLLSASLGFLLLPVRGNQPNTGAPDAPGT